MTFAEQLRREEIESAWTSLRAHFADRVFSLDPDRDLTFSRIEEEEPEDTGSMDFPHQVYAL